MTVESLNKHRAERDSDARLWTPLEALKDLVAAIESGDATPEQLVVHMWEKTEDGGSRHSYQLAGVTYPQHIALLHVALARTLSEWVGRDD